MATIADMPPGPFGRKWRGSAGCTPPCRVGEFPLGGGHSFANRPVPRLEQPKPTTRWLVAYPNRTTLHVGRNCASLPLTVSRWSTLMAREVTVPPPPPPGNSSSCLANILSSYLAFGSSSRGIPIGPCPTHPCMCTTHPYTLEIPRHSGCELPASLHSEVA